MKLHQKEFKPGFQFELRTKTDPEKWEKIKIHPNCDKALIENLLQTFQQTPEMFRRIGE